jgi:hypothetical protein
MSPLATLPPAEQLLSRVSQTKFTDAATGQQGNCHAACLASVFNLPIESVVDTADPALWHPGSSAAAWWRAVEAWLLLSTTCTSWHWYPSSGGGQQWLQGRWSIGGGVSPRHPTLHHSLVCYGGTALWDPHPSRAGISGAFTHHQVLVTAAERKLLMQALQNSNT